MTHSQRKRAVLVLLAVAMVLWVFWLLLPRVLGIAAERWLDIPGLESVRVTVDEIGSSQMWLREVRGVFRSGGGYRFRVALRDIALSYSPGERRLQRLDIARGELEIEPGTAAGTSSWPHIEWPTLPLNTVRIDDLQVTLQIANHRPPRVQGSFELRQLEGFLQSDFATKEGRARLTATPAGGSGNAVEFHAEWLPNIGTAADARLRIGRDPAAQPATLTGQAMLPDLARWANGLGIDLPLELTGGRLLIKMEAALGNTAGTLRTFSADAELDSAGGRTTGAVTPLQFALTGTLGFSWQAPISRIELKPGLQWRIDVGGKKPLQASGRLTESYRLRRTDGELRGEGAFPFASRSAHLGTWEGTAQGLRLLRTPTANTGQEGWSTAEMQMRIKGGINQWRHEAFHATGSKAEGTVELSWSRSNGIRAETAFQAGAEQLEWTGNSPVKTGRTTWKVNAIATAGTDIDSNIDFWKTLELNAEAIASPMNIGVSAGPKFTLHSTRLKLTRFRPGGQSGIPSASNAEGELTFSADAVNSGEWPALGLQTRFRFDKGRLRSDGSLFMQTAEMLRFSGSHAINSGCGDAVFSAKQSLQMLAKALQPRPAALAPLDLRTGDAEGHFTLDWCLNPKATFDARGTLQISDATLQWDKAWVEGVKGKVQLEGLNPIRGRIVISARLGELAAGTPLTDLGLDLALGIQTLSLNALHAQLLGGTVLSGPLTVDWPPANQPLPLEIRSIDLGKLLELLNVPGLSGSGQLNGILPFVPHTSAVEIRDGHLSSKGGGTLRYAPTLTLPDNPGLQALRNFHFRQLDMRVHYAADGAYRTQTMLEGSNPDFYSGYPIRFGLNINGTLPGLFRAAIFSGDFNRHILEQLQSGKLE